MSVKTIGKLDLSKIVQTKRHIDLSNEELANLRNFLFTTKKRRISDTSYSVDSEYDYPYEGDEGDLFWLPEERLPSIISNIEKTVSSLFGFGDEFNGCHIRVWPPAEVANGNDKGKCKDFKKVYNINSASNMATRIVISFNSGELLKFYHEKGSASAEGKFYNTAGSAILIPIAICSKVAIEFNNLNTGTLDPRRGFRPVTIRKDPTQRIMMVLDYKSNPKKLIDVIKKQTSDAIGGDVSKLNTLNELVGKVTGLDEKSLKEMKDSETDPTAILSKVSTIDQ